MELTYVLAGFRGGDKDKSTAADSSTSNSLNRTAGSGGHSRTYSDGSSAGSGSAAPSCHPTPPKGPRVVLGRETTPTEQPQKIPQDVWDKYDGKSREVRKKNTYFVLFDPFIKKKLGIIFSRI